MERQIGQAQRKHLNLVARECCQESRPCEHQPPGGTQREKNFCDDSQPARKSNTQYPDDQPDGDDNECCLQGRQYRHVALFPGRTSLGPSATQALSLSASFDFHAGLRAVVRGQQKYSRFGSAGGQDHAFRHAKLHLARRKIGHHYRKPALQ